MSGIYIPGMEMPTSCSECKFKTVTGLDRWKCCISKAEFMSWDAGWGNETTRHKGCPLVPVPEHGDLIDKRGVDVLSWNEKDEGDFEDGVLFVLYKSSRRRRKKIMQTPIKNDPFALVWMAFKKLFPDKDCDCWFDVVDDPDDKDGHYGWTQWNDDGTVSVAVDLGLRLADAVEIFAHELAHVAVGSDADHNAEWEAAFDAIHVEYNRIGNELFDEHTPTDCINAKALKPPKEETE